jgi:hypothetical protein
VDKISLNSTNATLLRHNEGSAQLTMFQIGHEVSPNCPVFDLSFISLGSSPWCWSAYPPLPQELPGRR